MKGWNSAAQSRINVQNAFSVSIQAQKGQTQLQAYRALKQEPVVLEFKPDTKGRFPSRKYSRLDQQQMPVAAFAREGKDTPWEALTDERISCKENLVPVIEPRQRDGSIKSLLPEDRPREKLMEKGVSALTEAELLALIISSGDRKSSALDLARKLITQAGGLGELGKHDIHDLMNTPGIGEAKGSMILAAIELGRRVQNSSSNKIQFTTSRQFAQHLRHTMAENTEETVRVIYLDRALQILAEKEVFRGGLTSVVLDQRIIYRQALQVRATKIVVCHNHPSGVLLPSEQDCRITQKLIETGNVVDITLVDHLILSPKGYFSMADEGILSKLQTSNWTYPSIKQALLGLGSSIGKPFQ